MDPPPMIVHLRVPLPNEVHNGDHERKRQREEDGGRRGSHDVAGAGSRCLFPSRLQHLCFP